MKPLSERDENCSSCRTLCESFNVVGMKPLSERDENFAKIRKTSELSQVVGMKPLSERDENICFHPKPIKTSPQK